MPFAGATIGKAFRNEIAPRSGLLRVREFTLAEIEHFVNPDKKDHPRYKYVKNLSLTLFPRENQTENTGVVQMTIDEALNKGILDNQTLSYFIGRVYMFMIDCGLIKEGIRFRQHLKSEMAHYAKDCWDCELLTSYGWIECVGIADRSCFDLQCHSIGSKQDLTAYEEYETPKIEKVLELEQIKGAIGKKFLDKSKSIIEYLSNLSEEEKTNFQKELDEKKSKKIVVNENEYEITSDMCSFKVKEKKVFGYNYTPGVIEPAFGIGRIIYSLLEHSYWIRPEVEEETDNKDKKDKKEKDKQIERCVLSLTPNIAPFKTIVLPFNNEEELSEITEKLLENLNNYGISHKVDRSGNAIGRKYARSDDIGIPFAITIDLNSPKDKKITLRERDTCIQIRCDINEGVEIVNDLVNKKISWEDVVKKYPEQQQSASEKVGIKN
jgi:glycyl-tRNA synthetase